MTGLHPRWIPLAESESADFAPPADPRELPIPFDLTPEDRRRAAQATQAIRAHVLRLNRMDTAQAVADELVRREAA